MIIKPLYLKEKYVIAYFDSPFQSMGKVLQVYSQGLELNITIKHITYFSPPTPSYNVFEITTGLWSTIDLRMNEEIFIVNTGLNYLRTEAN